MIRDLLFSGARLRGIQFEIPAEAESSGTPQILIATDGQSSRKDHTLGRVCSSNEWRGVRFLQGWPLPMKGSSISAHSWAVQRSTDEFIFATLLPRFASESYGLRELKVTSLAAKANF
jgi:hypothetical protein